MWKQGDRVRLVRTYTDFLEPGTEGIVVSIDDFGTVHVAWDNGSHRGMITEAGDVIEPAPMFEGICKNCNEDIRVMDFGDGNLVWVHHNDLMVCLMKYPPFTATEVVTIASGTPGFQDLLSLMIAAPVEDDDAAD